MTPRQALAGMLQIFAVFSFFVAGIFFTCLPYNLELCLKLANYLTERSDLCTWIGLSFFGLTILFTLGFYAATRGRYLLLRLGGNLVRIDVNILQKTIAPVLAKQFTGIRLSDVEIIRGQHLELRAYLDPLEPKEKEKLLLNVERHLTKLLSERFGYHIPFTLQILS